MTIQMLILQRPPIPRPTFLQLLLRNIPIYPFQYPNLLLRHSQILLGQHPLLGQYRIVVLLPEQCPDVRVGLHLGQVRHVSRPRIDLAVGRGLTQFHLDGYRGGLAVNAEAVPSGRFDEDGGLVGFSGDETEFFAETTSVIVVFAVVIIHYFSALGCVIVGLAFHLQFHEIVIHPSLGVDLFFQSIPSFFFALSNVVVPLVIAIFRLFVLGQTSLSSRRWLIPPRPCPTLLLFLLVIIIPGMLMLHIVMPIKLLPLLLRHGVIIEVILLLLFEIHHLRDPHRLHIQHIITKLAIHEHVHSFLLVSIQITS
mmetsp:Transcript_11832/g.21349  ORF Transcript_11832/g.21349 Transcript_11832/m.21349 type:complete len:310 (+) Transcript_11832:349-1278(+)